MKTKNIWYGFSSTYKTIKHLTMVFCLIFLLSACSTTSSTQRTQQKHDTGQPLTCSKGPDCEAKWDRALIWVQNYSEAAIQIANETIITTRTPQNSSSPVISITKTETVPGTYAIHFRANCSWILGCKPSISKLKASFANYIMKPTDLSPADGPQKAKTQSDKGTPARPRANLGVVTVKTSQAAANKLGMKEPRGTRITYIGPGAAFDSGLRLDDVILKFAEQTINDDQELDSALEKTGLAGTIPVTIWRAGTGELVISVRF